MKFKTSKIAAIVALITAFQTASALATTTNEDLENQITAVATDVATVKTDVTALSTSVSAVATNVVDIKSTVETTEVDVANLAVDTTDIKALVNSIQADLTALDASLAQQSSDNAVGFTDLETQLTNILAFVQQSECVTSKTVDLPTWLKGGSNARKTVYYVSNKSDQDVTIKINFTKSDGTVYDETTESGDNIRFAGITTDPVNTAGAVLSPDNSATVTNTSVGASGFGSATLTWESSTCLVNPLKVSARMEWVNKSDSWVEVNNGNRL